MIIKHQNFELFDKIVIERIIFKPPLKGYGSFHNEACFIYAVNGNSNVYGGNETNCLSNQEGVLMKCGNYLNSWLKTEDEEVNEAVAVHFYPEVLKALYQDKLPDFLTQKNPASSISIEKVKVDEMINRYIESLIFYFENPSLLGDELILLKVKELILLLVKTDRSERMQTILQDLFNPNEYKFKEIIQAHLFNPLTVDDLAVLTNLSVSSFKRKFKEVFHDSPAHYIKNKRLEKAAELLRVSKQRITEICFDCGFNDTSHFSKSFTSYFGMSPSEYREQQKVQ